MTLLSEGFVRGVVVGWRATTRLFSFTERQQALPAKQKMAPLFFDVYLSLWIYASTELLANLGRRNYAFGI